MEQVLIYFKRANGERRFIKEIQCEKEDIVDKSFSVIRNFVKTNYPHFTIYYTRRWEKDNGEIWFDVGSHTEFFVAKRKVMTYREVYKNLFSVEDDFYLAHCISADFALGAGIAVEFNKRFNMKQQLQNKHPNFIEEWTHHGYVGFCILEDKVFNLITKERYFQKPTYDSITQALVCMKDICIFNHIDKIAMPLIGCGLDRLDWNKVSNIIKEVFNDTAVEILVCRQ